MNKSKEARTTAAPVLERIAYALMKQASDRFDQFGGGDARGAAFWDAYCGLMEGTLAIPEPEDVPEDFRRNRDPFRSVEWGDWCLESHRSGKVFVRRQWFWLAWYPLRGRRCRFGFDEVQDGGWHFSAALGPLYFGTGSGRAVV